jgi:hypothetical protein
VQKGVIVGGGLDNRDLVLALEPAGKVRLRYLGTRESIRIAVTSAGTPYGVVEILGQGMVSERTAPVGHIEVLTWPEWAREPRRRDALVQGGEVNVIDLTDE